jgi:hypothetical protein
MIWNPEPDARISSDDAVLSFDRGWPTLSHFSLLTCDRNWMIPLQYVHAEELVLPFRVADPFGFLKRRGFDFSCVP